MTYEYQAWPAWCHGPKGESQIFDSEKDVPKGWTHHEEPKKAKAEKAPTEKGGEKSAEVDDIKALRAAYQEKFGKKSFGAWDAATLKAKLDDAG